MDEHLTPIERYEKGVDPEYLFDWHLFGAMLRNRRTRMGYKTAESFARTIYNRTRYTVTKEQMYKIESGRRMPNGSELVAIALAIGKPHFMKILDACACDEWKAVAELGTPFVEWREENASMYALETTGKPDADSDEWRAVMDVHSDMIDERPECLYPLREDIEDQCGY